MGAPSYRLRLAYGCGCGAAAVVGCGKIADGHIEEIQKMPATATVVAATVGRAGDGSPESAPLIARLPDGRQMALAAADDETLGAMGETDVPGTVGGSVVVLAGAARYRLATD